MGGCQCDTGAQRVTQWARGLPGAPLGFDRALLQRLRAHKFTTRAADGVQKRRSRKPSFSGRAGSERPGEGRVPREPTNRSGRRGLGRGTGWGGRGIEKIIRQSDRRAGSSGCFGM